MVSEYLNKTRSLAELDELFERDRVAAAKIAAVSFAHEVTLAVTNIDEINKVANARILADSQVASAKMMTDAEITATHLLAMAELARLDIVQASKDDSTDGEIQRSMVDELNRAATASITGMARESVEDIRRNAEAAISRLKDNATEAIEEIQGLAEDVGERVARNVEIAKAKLAEAKLRQRTPEEAVRQAEAEAATVLEDALANTRALRDLAINSIINLNVLTDEAVKILTTTVVSAETRVAESREKALAKIRAVVDMELRR